MPYAKLHSQIVNSSIWSEDSDTCKVWITLLALSDREGFVFGSPLGLSRIAALPVEKVAAILEKFKGPDEHSSDTRSNPENMGRRIEETGSGWKLINYEHYRELKDADEQREMARQRKRKQRKRDSHTESVTERDAPGRTRVRHAPSRDVTPSEAEAEAYSEMSTSPHPSKVSESSDFIGWWKVYPKKVGKGDALSAWRRLSPEDRRSALEAAPKFSEAWNGAPSDRLRFIPNPATFLRQQRWTDDPTEWSRQAGDETGRSKKTEELDPLALRAKKIMQGEVE